MKIFYGRSNMSIKIHTTSFNHFVQDIKYVADKITSTRAILDSIQKQRRNLSLKMRVSLLTALQMNLAELKRLTICGEAWNRLQPSPAQRQIIQDINAIVSNASLIGADTIQFLRRNLNIFHTQTEINFDKPRIYLAVSN